MLRRFVLALAILALLASAAWTQTPVPERRVFAVSVLGSSGKPLEGLSAADFRGEYRGHPVKILSVVADNEPRRVGVIVDISASMGESWELAWAAADHAVQTLAGRNRVGLFTVGAELNQEAEFTHERPLLRSALWLAWRKKARGTTSIVDGLIQGIDQHFPPGWGNTIYLITDAQENTSLATLRDLEERLRRTNTRLFVAWISTAAYSLPEMRRAKWLRSRLAEASGGLAVDLQPDDEEKIVTQLQPLYASINRVYRVEVEFPRPIDKRRQWKLEVIGPDGKKRKDVQVLYPRLLVPLSEN